VILDLTSRLRVRSIAQLACDGTNLREGREMEGKQDTVVRKLVASHSNAETRFSRELNCVPLISAVREYGLVLSGRTRKQTSAHVSSHFDRALARQCAQLHV
jgi:hypothetical protein